MILSFKKIQRPAAKTGSDPLLSVALPASKAIKNTHYFSRRHGAGTSGAVPTV
jgi:hypothetical protein